jgi:hypothetical protein
MKLTLLLAVILLSAVSTAAQTHFYLDEPFKHPAKIPDGLVPLLRDEIKKVCRGETVSQGADVKSWFSASRISVSGHRSAFILTSGKPCLTGADHDWFWVYLKTTRGYRLALFGGAISVDSLKTRTHGLRDIETNAATANTNYTEIYKFNGLAYKIRVCMEASPVGARSKRVPCRTQ